MTMMLLLHPVADLRVDDVALQTGHRHLATHPAWEARQAPGVTAETKTTAGATVLAKQPPLPT